MLNIKVITLLIVLFVIPYSSVMATEKREIKHQWGTTTIEGIPKRIVSLSYNGIDNWLALGVQPIAYRVWYGGNKFGLWPWAKSYQISQDAKLLRGFIDPETIAYLKPDLIEAMYSGMTRSQYIALSKIAPVIPPIRKVNFSATWKEMISIFGETVGKEKLASEKILSLEKKFQNIRESHPLWSGRTVVMALPNGPMIFTEQAARIKVLKKLGFRLSPAVQKLSRGGFFFRLDRELTEPLEADVLIWLNTGAGVKQVLHHPLRNTMRTPREGREIVTNPDITAALSYSTILSLDYVLDHLVPLIENAIDGDPKTKVDSNLKTGLIK